MQRATQSESFLLQTLPLQDDLYEMLVVLRMNRDFMIFMRKYYFAEIKALQPFNMAVVKFEEEEA